jgi:carbon starvation protein
MSTLWLTLGGFLIYVVLYHVWGKTLQRNLVQADDTRETPAVRFRDDIDYLPTNRFVLFGHHFASIAGAAPIVGPVIALAWGWLPAILWVWFGNVLIGAIHDYLSLMASVRHEGRTIQWISGRLISERAA